MIRTWRLVKDEYCRLELEYSKGVLSVNGGQDLDRVDAFYEDEMLALFEAIDDIRALYESEVLDV